MFLILHIYLNLRLNLYFFDVVYQKELTVFEFPIEQPSIYYKF